MLGERRHKRTQRTIGAAMLRIAPAASCEREVQTNAAAHNPRRCLLYMNAFARSTLPVLNVLGYVVLMFATTILVPLTFAVIGDEMAAQGIFGLTLLVTAGSALLLVLSTRRFARELQARDGFLLVTLAWTVLPAFATLPLLLQLPNLSFTDAYFETMSGLTTTGATVLTGLDHLPLSINVWRHLLVWLGGMGILVLGRRDPAAVGCRWRAGVQGRDGRADEGGQAHSAHRRYRQGAVRRVLQHFDRLLFRLSLGRHDAGATPSCTCARRWDLARFLVPRRQLRLLGLGR